MTEIKFGEMRLYGINFSILRNKIGVEEAISTPPAFNDKVVDVINSRFFCVIVILISFFKNRLINSGLENLHSAPTPSDPLVVSLSEDSIRFNNSSTKFSQANVFFFPDLISTEKNGSSFSFTL